MPSRRNPQAEMRPVAASNDAEATADGRRLSEVAYQAILEGLFTRKVPTGAFLSQSDLVRMLGVPVQPLRDALRILEAEGVLTIHPRAGIEFLKPDLELARSTLPGGATTHYRNGLNSAPTPAVQPATERSAPSRMTRSARPGISINTCRVNRS